MFRPWSSLSSNTRHLPRWCWNWCSLLQPEYLISLIPDDTFFSMLRMTACFLSFSACNNSYRKDLVDSISPPFISSRKAMSVFENTYIALSNCNLILSSVKNLFHLFCELKIRNFIARLTNIVCVLELIKRIAKLSGIVLEFFLCLLKILFWRHSLFQFINYNSLLFYSNDK